MNVGMIMLGQKTEGVFRNYAEDEQRDHEDVVQALAATGDVEDGKAVAA